MSNWRNMEMSKEFEAIHGFLADLWMDAKRANNQAMIDRLDKLIAMINEVESSIV